MPLQIVVLKRWGSVKGFSRAFGVVDGTIFLFEVSFTTVNPRLELIIDLVEKRAIRRA